MQSQAGIIAKEIGEIEGEGPKLAELRETLGDIEQRLARGDFAAGAQAALADLEAQLADLGYDAGKHEQARRELSQLEHYEPEKRRLDEALRLLDREKEGLAQVREEAEAKRAEMKLDTEKKEALTKELADLPQAGRELDEAEAAYQEAVGQRARAQETLGSVRARLQRLTELEARKKEKETGWPLRAGKAASTESWPGPSGRRASRRSSSIRRCRTSRPRPTSSWPA